jgi:hypothetical protein
MEWCLMKAQEQLYCIHWRQNNNTCITSCLLKKRHNKNTYNPSHLHNRKQEYLQSISLEAQWRSLHGLWHYMGGELGVPGLSGTPLWALKGPRPQQHCWKLFAVCKAWMGPAQWLSMLWRPDPTPHKLEPKLRFLPSGPAQQGHSASKIIGSIQFIKSILSDTASTHRTRQ